MSKKDGRSHNLIPLTPQQLRRRCDPAGFKFKTTSDVKPLTGLVGQERAMEAIRFGGSIDQPSYNMFVLGPPETGKHTAVRSFLEDRAGKEPAPDDWVYVHNFTTPHKPRAIRLPAGQSLRLREAMVRAVDELRSALPAMFESEEYRSRRRAIDEEFHHAQEQAFKVLNEKAGKKNITVLKTPMGFALAPVSEGKVIKPDVFNALPEKERAGYEKVIESLQKVLEDIVEQIPRRDRKRRDNIRALNAEIAEIAVRQALADMRSAFKDIADVQKHLDAVRDDLIDNAGFFLGGGEDGAQQAASPGESDTDSDARFRRYMVNQVVSSSEDGIGAPIEVEDHPTLGNLVGRIEHISQMGTLVTDFLLIKPGALHRANGGYLMLDARNVLMQPFSWEALKRALKAGHIAIESISDQFSLVSTVSLQPDPVPLALKVVLFGDRLTYYLLASLDPEFPELFKVAADFDDETDRSVDTEQLYMRLIASIAQKSGLKPVTADGVARTIEEAARMAADAEKLSIRLGPLGDLLREADFWAGEARHKTITAVDVNRARSEQIRRADRLREKSHEAIGRGIMLVDTKGTQTGQVNGLSVIQLGNFAFGRPSRITARVRMGAGKLVDIEREVKLGGPIHSKGVLILSGFLSGRYAGDVPVSLSASLVFEQSYGGVEGDSASSAELYALMSALAGVPIKQSIAVTGSVNQFGQVQAIGGVNEKIEGFFDVCRQRGLTGEQGVIIPKSNEAHLMLREDVVEAAKKGNFSVWSVETIDEGIEILTGIAAGKRGGDEAFPDGSVNRLVEDRLLEFAHKRKSFAKHKNDAETDGGEA